MMRTRSVARRNDRPRQNLPRVLVGLAAVIVVGALVVPDADASSSADLKDWAAVASASPSPLAGLALAVSESGASDRADGAPSELRTADGTWELVKSASGSFGSGALDPGRWGIYDGKGNQGVGLRKPEAVRQDGSSLSITARGDVSGGVAQNHGQVYGRWEVRARMDKGAGYGPAILLWPDSERWPADGEVDIVEIPSGTRDAAVMTVHYGKANKQLGTSIPGDYSQWHTYAVDWLPDHIAFFIDGVERYRVTDPAAIPRTSMHLAIQNDVGKCGSWIGCRDGFTPSEVSLEVSDVRVYERG